MYLFKRIEPIREDDEYANWRAHIKVRYVRMNAPIKIDIATGDSITPAQVEYPYPMMFDDGTIRAMSSVWATYTRSAPYASSIPFDDVVDAVLELGEAVFHR